MYCMEMVMIMGAFDIRSQVLDIGQLWLVTD